MIATISLNSCIDRTLEAENFSVGSHCRARLVSESPAGKGMNVARILGTLRVPTRIYGFVGQDTAASFAKCLTEDNVENRLQILPQRTRVNTTIIDPATRTDTHLRETGATISHADVAQLTERLTRELVEGDWACFCGSLPPGLEPRDFADMLQHLATHGIRIAVDTSGPALKHAMRSGCHLMKPNREELASLVAPEKIGRDAMVRAARKAMLASGSHNLVILASDGAEGAYLVDRDRAWRGRTVSGVRVRSTVGAGDALLAGYLWGVARQDMPEERLRKALAIAGASLSCAQAGRLPTPLPDIRVDVLALKCRTL